MSMYENLTGNVIKKNIGRKIYEARISLNITQVELSEQLNMEQRNISLWENGKGVVPIEYLPNICDKLNIDIDDLLNVNEQHIEKNRKYIQLGKDVLTVLNIDSPENFYDNYQLVNREQTLIFPENAYIQLIADISSDIKNDLKDHDKGFVFQNCYYEFLKISKEEEVKKILSNVLNDCEKTENKQSKSRTNSIRLFNTLKAFFGFWTWVNTLMADINDELTRNGLELMCDPITYDEYFENKTFFPNKPGQFVNVILLNRGYERLINYEMIPKEVIDDWYQELLNENDVEIYSKIAYEKFNYVPKIKFYGQE